MVLCNKVILKVMSWWMVSPWKQYMCHIQAQETYEKAMDKARKEHERSNVSPAIFPEYQLWEDHWIR